MPDGKSIGDFAQIRATEKANADQKLTSSLLWGVTLDNLTVSLLLLLPHEHAS